MRSVKTGSLLNGESKNSAKEHEHGADDISAERDSDEIVTMAKKESDETVTTAEKESDEIVTLWRADTIRRTEWEGK